MTHADIVLAQRIERAEAANARGCTAAFPVAEFLEAAGGVAVFAGAESPLSRAAGMGLCGAVPAAQFDEVEDFFEARGARPVIDVCPLAHPSLIGMLGARGYRVMEFDNVLVRRLAGAEIVLTPRVRRGMPDEIDLWSHTAGCGFFEHSLLTTGEMDVGRAICAMPGAMWYLASADASESAGAAAMAIHSGLAVLFADSTIAAHRRRGIHRELILARLNEALAQGCDLATASTMPGSGSQRNYERLGFEVVYTRITFERG
ncbi:MAG TPA: hypothetical protein VKE70_11055 [Candidatus Solibacter sp.]|nr:hypothetical protein [Candidatus Solibacter sp.]